MASYLSSKYNQSINVSITRRDDLCVVVTYYSDTTEISPVLHLNKFKQLHYNQSSRIVESIGKREYVLQKTDAINNGLYVYAAVLTERDLPEIGMYTGTVTVTKTYRDIQDTTMITNEILDLVPVVIDISPNDNDILTDIQNPDLSRKTLKEVMVEVFSTLYQKPTGNGYISYDEQKFVFKGSDNGYLPVGSTFTVREKVSLSMTKYDKVLLERTSIDGYFNGEDITNDKTPASIARVSGLSAGEYIIYAEYINQGKYIKTEDTTFEVRHSC